MNCAVPIYVFRLSCVEYGLFSMLLFSGDLRACVVDCFPPRQTRDGSRRLIALGYCPYAIASWCWFSWPKCLLCVLASWSKRAGVGRRTETLGVGTPSLLVDSFHRTDPAKMSIGIIYRASTLFCGVLTLIVLCAARCCAFVSNGALGWVARRHSKLVRIAIYRWFVGTGGLPTQGAMPTTPCRTRPRW